MLRLVEQVKVVRGQVSVSFGVIGYQVPPRPLEPYKLWRPEWGVDPVVAVPGFDPEVN